MILLPLVGLTWVVGFVLIDNAHVILAFGILSALLNALQASLSQSLIPLQILLIDLSLSPTPSPMQGLFIFVFHVVRSNRVSSIAFQTNKITF